MDQRLQDIPKLKDLKKRLDQWEHLERLIGNTIEVYDLLDLPNHPLFFRIIQDLETTPEELKQLLWAIEDGMIS